MFQYNRIKVSNTQPSAQLKIIAENCSLTTKTEGGYNFLQPVIKEEEVRLFKLFQHSFLEGKIYFGEYIGEGQDSKVYKAINVVKNVECVVKKIEKSKQETKKLGGYIDESQFIKLLNHKNIIKYLDQYSDNETTYIFQEACHENLLIKIQKDIQLTEKITQSIAQQLLSALQYTHQQGIIHRDVKLEKIMLNHIQNKIQVKLGDFGQSCWHKEETFEKDIRGSIYYMAPEVLKQKYNEKCDVWSLGIVLFTLITGHYPYGGENIKGTVQDILNKKIVFNRDEEKRISQNGRFFILKLLERDLDKRYTTTQALQDKWLMKPQWQEAELISEEDDKLLGLPL